jgi:hypothetical protein
VTGPLLHPTSELVAEAWIADMLGISQSCVATQAPQDATTWPLTNDGVILEFITVRVVGGTPQPNIPIARPVIEIQCYATKPSSNKPPWFAANQRLEQIRLACYERTLYTFGRALTITTGGKEYNGASVISSVFHTEPRRLYSTIQNYAVYQADAGFTWREIGLTVQ